MNTVMIVAFLLQGLVALLAIGIAYRLGLMAGAYLSAFAPKTAKTAKKGE